MDITKEQEFDDLITSKMLEAFGGKLPIYGNGLQAVKLQTLILLEILIEIKKKK